jgi:pentatricopeptide repeat protein
MTNFLFLLFEFRYREVVDTYHLMIAHRIQPSKSSFSFALRACSFLKDGEQAVRVIRGAQLAGAATPFMYNSTLVLLDGMKRNDMALKVLRDILSIGALPDSIASPASPMNSSYAPNGDDEDHYQGQSSSNHVPTTRMRLPPGWLTRRIISNALQNLTENFAVYFTDVKNGRLTPNKELRPFVNEVAEVLKGTVHDRNLYLSTSAYPMANKILLDCGDFETLQTLLNHTLYKPEVNTTRLYDFALKSLLKDSPTQQGVDVILLFVGDIMKATIPQYASSLLLAAMERLALSKIKSASSPSEYPLPLLSNSDLEPAFQSEIVPKRGVDMTEVYRAQLLHRLFEGGRKLLGMGLPKRAYIILAHAYKKADLPVLMVNLYKVALEDSVDDRMLKNIIVFTLARSSEHWDMAIEILEDIRKLNGGVSDINMYYTAFTACDSGRDWEQALYLLNRMREEGHPMTTIAVTSVITACSACGQADEALRLLQMMEDKGIERTVWTYNAAISACAKKGNWRGALSVFEKMRENSIIASKDTNGPSVLQASTSSSAVIGPDDASSMGNTIADGRITENIVVEDEEEEEEEEEEDEDEVEEEGWDERLNPNFDVSLGTGNYEMSEEYVEGVEEVGLFNGMRGVANQVTYNTLIEALGEGGQVVLVDELYREAVDNNIVSPLLNFKKGWIDLHGHSVHMAKAAIRYAFEYLLSLEPSELNTDSERKPFVADYTDSVSSIPSGEVPLGGSINSTNSKKAGKKRELAVIVGKGRKLVPVIQKLLLEEFHPSVRSSVSKTNSGRLLLCEGDISKWLAIHKSLR